VSEAPAVTRVLRQWFRYDYASPVRNLRHRLVVVPPEVHGTERRLAHSVWATGAGARLTSRTDDFGNHVVEIWAPVVRRSIEFEIRAVVRRQTEDGDSRLSPAVARDPRLLRATALTRADDALGDAVGEIAARRPAVDHPLALAEQVCSWAHGALRYQYGVTTVRTTAAQALAGGVGVCQDYAHLMAAMCRALGVACRYVSGHLVGQGGSHAWVEVVLPSPAGATIVAFDPTHDRHAGRSYLTVAVGRDYADVAPTSGTFEGDGVGVLTATKRLDTVDNGPSAEPVVDIAALADISTVGSTL
jgi:transglutaminase-like putative cysteine protease